ncbi:MAG: hypothetical protein NWS65_07935 [Candidatus Nanopelagicales bacterium]|jgi:hypothetical protein|nr:hypothetical protein [Candidatus Nanopelagicales bacterium]
MSNPMCATPRPLALNRVFTGIETVVVAGTVIAAIVHTPLGEWNVLTLLLGAALAVAAVFTGYSFIRGTPESSFRAPVFNNPQRYVRLASILLVVFVAVMSFTVVGNIVAGGWSTSDILLLGLWSVVAISLVSMIDLARRQG